MSWICPHCGTVATLQTVDRKSDAGYACINTAPDSDGIGVRWSAIRCPNKKCGKYVLDVWAHFGTMARYHPSQNGGRTGKCEPDAGRPVGIGYCKFEPRVGAPLSEHVPQVVKQDYEEACQIKDLSPKAAATLCRRALQGMVRDFWKVVKSRLVDELKAIEQKCDPDLYKAMMGLKGVGNIGAHPERDINLIVDVEEGEVESLIELLRILDKEWYVARAKRAASLAIVIALGADKEAAQKAATSGEAEPAPQPGS